MDDRAPRPRDRAKDVSDEVAEAYYRENKEGFDAWNAYVAEHGLPLVDNWDF